MKQPNSAELRAAKNTLLQQGIANFLDEVHIVDEHQNVMHVALPLEWYESIPAVKLQLELLSGLMPIYLYLVNVKIGRITVLVLLDNYKVSQTMDADAVLDECSLAPEQALPYVEKGYFPIVTAGLMLNKIDKQLNRLEHLVGAFSDEIVSEISKNMTQFYREQTGKNKRT